MNSIRGHFPCECIGLVATCGKFSYEFKGLGAMNQNYPCQWRRGGVATGLARAGGEATGERRHWARGLGGDGEGSPLGSPGRVGPASGDGGASPLGSPGHVGPASGD